MSARYNITDDVTGEEIPQGIPHYELRHATRAVQGYTVQEPTRHYLHLEDVLRFISDVGKFDEVVITSR